MADLLVRRDPVPGVPAVHDGVTVSLAPSLRRWSLRARDAAALEAVVRQAVPRSIGETIGDVACLGPDEFLWRSVAAKPSAHAVSALSVVDVSERSVMIMVEGPRARAVLNAGCPLDLERFAVGRTTRTVYEGVEIILHRAGETQWTADVWRSFADWFWLHLNTSAAEPTA